MPQSSPSVLIIRLDGIGDALALAPLVAALKSRGFAVDAALSARNAAIFARSALRNVEVAPISEKLRARAYDAVLVATEDASGYRLARRIGAPSTGFANGFGKPLKTLWVRSMLTRTLYRSAGLDKRKPHECEVLFKLGAGIVAETAPTRDLARLRPLVLEAPPFHDERVVVQVTEKWRRFGVDVRDLARFLAELAHEMPVHAVAARDEDAFAGDVERAAEVRVERYGDLDSWKQRIASGRALVAPDSGATHVAGMVGTPVVALFPPMRRLDRQIARWHPWAAPWRAVTVERKWPERTRAMLRQLLSLDRA